MAIIIIAVNQYGRVYKSQTELEMYCNKVSNALLNRYKEENGITKKVRHTSAYSAWEREQMMGYRFWCPERHEFYIQDGLFTINSSLLKLSMPVLDYTSSASILFELASTDFYGEDLRKHCLDFMSKHLEHF